MSVRRDINVHDQIWDCNNRPIPDEQVEEDDTSIMIAAPVQSTTGVPSNW